MSSWLMKRVVPVASFCSSGRSASTRTSPISTASPLSVMFSSVVKSGVTCTFSATNGAKPIRFACTTYVPAGIPMMK